MRVKLIKEMYHGELPSEYFQGYIDCLKDLTDNLCDREISFLEERVRFLKSLLLVRTREGYIPVQEIKLVDNYIYIRHHDEYLNILVKIVYDYDGNAIILARDLNHMKEFFYIAGNQNELIGALTQHFFEHDERVSSSSSYTTYDVQNYDPEIKFQDYELFNRELLL